MYYENRKKMEKCQKIKSDFESKPLAQRLKSDETEMRNYYNACKWLKDNKQTLEDEAIEHMFKMSANEDE